MSQIFNEKENKNMPSSMSLDEKVSDLVGVANYKVNDKFSLNYNFAIDQIIMILIIMKLSPNSTLIN